MENINTTAKVLSQKKEAIPDLRDALREAKGRLQEAEKAKQLEEKENALKKEKCWAHVYEKEGQLEQAAEELASAEARLSKIKGELEQAEVHTAHLCHTTSLTLLTRLGRTGNGHKDSDRLRGCHKGSWIH